jgi:hypothetical protein
MSSSDSLPVPRKNTAYRAYFPILKGDGSIITGWTSAAATLSKDGAASASATNTPTEIATSWGIGYLDLTATEMNADAVIIKATVTNTGAMAQVIVLYPQEAGDIHANADNVSEIQSGLATASDISNLQTHGDANWSTGSSAPTTAEIVDAIDADSVRLAQIATKTDLITADNFTVIAPVDPLSGDLTIVRGDDYTAASGRILPSWSSDDWTVFDLTHAEEVTFRARSKYSSTVFEKAADVLSGTLVRVQLTSAETSVFALGQRLYDFDLQAILGSGDVITLAQGQINVKLDVR